MMFTIRIVGIGIVCLLFSCTAPKRNISRQNTVKEQRLALPGNEVANDKILFLTLGVTLTDSAQDIYAFSVHNSIFADGKMTRNGLQTDISLEPYQLYCELSDQNKKKIELISVQNPLLQLIEYSSEPGKLEKKIFSRKQGEIFLRFQYSKNTKYLTIYKPQPDLRTLKKIYHAQI